jgi:hypothetical protein
MWLTIVTAGAIVWHWLPPLTIMLKFCSALIGFVIAVPMLVRRARRWSHRRR